MGKPRIPGEEAARLVEAYEPITLILDIMNAARSAGLPHGFAVMETAGGCTATLTTGTPITKTIRAELRETLKRTAVPRG